MFKGVSTFENPKTLSSSLSGWFGWCLYVVLVDSSRLNVTEDFFRRDFSKKLKKRGGGEESNIQKKEGQNMNKKISQKSLKRQKRLSYDEKRHYSKRSLDHHHPETQKNFDFGRPERVALEQRILVRSSDKSPNLVFSF